MDSIKFNAKGHNVEFTKRSLTIDGKVYSYTGIRDIKHSSAYHAYLFKYNGQWVKLFYNEPDGKVIATLFKRIQKMNERRASYARATQSIDTSAIAAALEGTDAKAAEPAAEPAPEPEVVEPEIPAEVIPAEGPEAEPEAPVEEAPAEEPAAEPETPVEEAPAEEPAKAAPAEEPAAEPEVEEPEAPAEAVPEEEKPEEKPAEEPVKDADKKARRKKAFIIFAIIIALFIIAGIIYFLTVGPTTDASQGQPTDGTHQYNDIEELIEEMQD